MVSGDEWGTHGGRLTPGNIHTDAAGNVINPSEPSTALVPAKDEPPSVTAQDLAHLDSDAADIDAQLDAEFAQRAAAMRRAGFSDEEVRRLSGEPAAKAPSTAEAEPAEPDGLDAIESELAEIANLRKTDRRAYDKNEKMQQREAELLQAREDAKGAARVHEQGTAMVQSILNQMPDAHAFDASFMGVFNAMAEESQEALRQGLATPADTLIVRPASDEQLANFASLSDDAATLVKSWGSRGARRLGQVHARIDAMVDNLSDADYERAGAWIDALSAEQRVAMVKALAE